MIVALCLMKEPTVIAEVYLSDAVAGFKSHSAILVTSVILFLFFCFSVFSPRPVDTYRTLDSGYRAPSRQQLDPYAAQPQVSRVMRTLGSALEMRYGQGLYGLEDDQRSVGYDDYSMGPPPMHPGGYGTMPRQGPGPAGIDRRRLR